MRTSAIFGVLALILGLVSTAASSAVAAPGIKGPAEFKTPPVGTILDYGSWNCRVEPGGKFETVCSQGERRVRLYGGMFPHGRLDRNGYGGFVGHIYCVGFATFANTDVYPLGRAKLSAKARRAIRSLWPLEVGKKIEFSTEVSGQDEPIDSTVEVVGTEEVSIAAKRRTVFKLKGKSNLATECEGQITSFEQTWWYDADNGVIVRYEMRAWEGLKPGQARHTLMAAVYPRISNEAYLLALKEGQKQPGPQLDRVRPVADTTPPELDLPNTIEAHGPVITIAGRVKDRSKVVEVAVAGRPLFVAEDGSFTVQRGLTRSADAIEVTAVDEWGNVSRHRIAVTRTSGASIASVRETQPPPRKASRFTDVRFGRYHALVIGNNRYRHLPRLKLAVADADAVSQTLETNYEFKVTSLTDATRGDILGALAKLRATLKPEDNLLIYYAGHGILDKAAQEGYWLPTDAQASNPANWISTNDVTVMLRTIRSRHILVVADSCYSGTLVRAADARLKTSRNQKAWIKRMLSKRARTALVSGGLEPVVDGGGGGHSVFAKALLDALRENDGVMEGQTLFERIKRPVVLNADQTPQYSDIRKAGHEGGDFVFVRRR